MGFSLYQIAINRVQKEPLTRHVASLPVDLPQGVLLNNCLILFWKKYTRRQSDAVILGLRKPRAKYEPLGFLEIPGIHVFFIYCSVYIVDKLSKYMDPGL